MRCCRAFPVLILNGLLSVASALIIGGENATMGRFPYTVALISEDGSLLCSASLIAPDMVLSAAHCASTDDYEITRVWINPGTLSNLDPSYEDMTPLQEFIHPDFNGFDSTYDTVGVDAMIIQLAQPSTFSPIQMNNNTNIPVAAEILTAMGWGVDTPDLSSFADTLQVLNVTYIPNDVCRNRVAYTFLSLSEDELCADGFNLTGICYGDSGGPLILPGADAEEDLQVGITSWSHGSHRCQSPIYEDVWARTSSAYEWVRSIVCNNSIDPPANFECDELSQSPSVSPSPTFDSEQILIALKLYGWETISGGVAIRATDVESDTFVTEEVYGDIDEQDFAILMNLVRDRTYEIEVIVSSYEYDELYGTLHVYLGDEADSTSILGYVNLFECQNYPGEDSGCSTPILTSLNGITPIEQLVSGSPTVAPPPPEASQQIMVWYRTPFNPYDQGWVIQTAAGDLVEQVPPGTYQIGGVAYTHTLNLVKDATYLFTVTSAKGEGSTAEVFIIAGNTFEESAIVGIYNGYNVYDEFYYDFFEFNFTFVASPDATVGVFPTITPSVSPIPTSTPTTPLPSSEFQVELLVYIEFDSFPTETGWRIETANGQRLGGADPGTYGDSTMSSILKVVTVDEFKEYVFVLLDSWGDGFNGEAIVYLGSVANDHILARYSPIDEFDTEWRVTFSLSPGDDDTQENESKPLVRPIRDCTTSNPCVECEGDCDNDSHCQGGLVCFQRDEFTPIPGCSGTDISRTDYCILDTN